MRSLRTYMICLQARANERKSLSFRLPGHEARPHHHCIPTLQGSHGLGVAEFPALLTPWTASPAPLRLEAAWGLAEITAVHTEVMCVLTGALESSGDPPGTSLHLAWGPADLGMVLGLTAPLLG